MMPILDKPSVTRDTRRAPCRTAESTGQTIPAGPETSLISLVFGPGWSKNPAVWGGIAGLALLVAMFWDRIEYLVITWYTDANYSHGFLVPLISLYFANEAAKRGSIRAGGGFGIGVALLVLAILGRIPTLVIPVGVVADISLILGLAGVVAILAGRDALHRFGFALAFLAFMVPLPIALYTAIANPLQMLVSKIAAAVLNAIGTPVLCQGNLMTLPGGVQMFVAEACSGMRQLTGFLALTTAVAFLSERPRWYRLIIVVSSVPIAMTANIIRVVLTGLIMHHIDPKYASGSLHTMEGLLMMGLGLALLAGECMALNWAVPPAPPAPTHDDGPVPDPHASRAPRRGFDPRVTWVVSLLGLGLGAQLAFTAATACPRPPLRTDQGLAASLPFQLGSWIGQDVPMDPEVLRSTQCTDYVNRVYVSTRDPGRSFSLWINYSKFGTNLRHSPEVCLPSSGWEKVESQTVVLDVERPQGPPTKLTRLSYRQGELVQGVGFWYYIFGEGALERYVRSLRITNRSSHGRTTRGSSLTVEVFCPGESDPDGEALRDFAAALLDQLEPLLPEERANYFRP